MFSKSKNKIKKNNIADDLKKDKKRLTAEIDNIRIRQQELQNFITSIETNINGIETLIDEENNLEKPNYKKLAALRTTLFKNIELLKQLYDSYKGFEEVKFKYQKLIVNSKLDYNKLIYLQIRRLDEQFNRATSDSDDLIVILRKLTENMENHSQQSDFSKKKNPILDNIHNEISNDVESEIYSMS
jgi:chromosome segregation ATPase